MSVRVSTLAKELGITSKELISKLRALKVAVKSHMSSLDDDIVTLLKKGKTPKKSVKRATGKVKAKPAAKKKTGKKQAKQVSGEAKEPAKKTKPVVRTKVEEEKKIELPVPEAPASVVEEEKEVLDLKVLKINLPITVKDLGLKLETRPNDLIKRLLNKKILVTINQSLDEGTANSLAEEFGYRIEPFPSEEETFLIESEKDDPKKLKPRAPIVTFMGHVDHGKTSLMDMIRKTKVVDKEAGGITQHIGAYEVVLPKGKVTFLDTPGHAAFTAMRARGANITDVVVLVVAADDGIMPQTIEAIDHARAANVPIVVAINKIDKQNISLDKVKKQLAERDLAPEDWGGKTITIGVSAKTGQGIDGLLEMLLLEAEMLELKANPDRLARGVVVEAELSKGKGPVATVLVSSGTLNLGDTIIVGLNYGKVKAMLDDKAHRIREAGPAKPVEILGLSGVPSAGEKFYVVADEKKARGMIEARRLDAEKKKLEAKGQKISLDDL